MGVESNKQERRARTVEIKVPIDFDFWKKDSDIPQSFFNEVEEFWEKFIQAGYPARILNNHPDELIPFTPRVYKSDLLGVLNIKIDKKYLKSHKLNVVSDGQSLAIQSFRNAIEQDTMTRVLGREAYLDRGAEKVLECLNQKNNVLAVFFIDNDFFEAFNKFDDRFGDIAIKAVLDLLKETSSKKSEKDSGAVKNIGRFAGEETSVFLSLTHDLDNKTGSGSIIQKIECHVANLQNNIRRALVGFDLKLAEKTKFNIFHKYEDIVLKERGQDYNERFYFLFKKLLKKLGIDDGENQLEFWTQIISYANELQQDEEIQRINLREMYSRPSEFMKLVRWFDKHPFALDSLIFKYQPYKKQENINLLKFIHYYNCLGSGVKNNPEILINRLDKYRFFGLQKLADFVKENKEIKDQEKYNEILSIMKKYDEVLYYAVEAHISIGTVTVGALAHDFRFKEGDKANRVSQIKNFDLKIKDYVYNHGLEKIFEYKDQPDWDVVTLGEVIKWLDGYVAVYPKLDNDVSAVKLAICRDWFVWLVEKASQAERFVKLIGGVKRVINSGDSVFDQSFDDKFDRAVLAYDQIRQYEKDFFGQKKNKEIIAILDQMRAKDLANYPLWEYFKNRNNKEFDEILNKYFYDNVTKVFGRYSLEILNDKFEKEILTKKEKCAVVGIDFDRLRSVNATLGYKAGDIALRIAVQTATDMLYKFSNGQARFIRKGGEEMVIIWPGKNSIEIKESIKNIQIVVEKELQNFYYFLKFPGINKVIKEKIGIDKFKDIFGKQEPEENGLTLIMAYNFFNHPNEQIKIGSFTAVITDLSSNPKAKDLWALVGVAENGRKNLKNQGKRGEICIV
ncbi:MAG: diguanylate cyclase [Patescibacteria group bacterium]